MIGSQQLISALSPAMLQTLGRFHVVIVHFPIALLLLAGAAELWRSMRRKTEPSPMAIACLVAGALAAAVSSALGWIHKGFTGFASESSQTLALHQWIGIASAATAVVALLIAAFRRRGSASLAFYRVTTIACALLVAAAGHFGGTLTHGEGYLTELIFPGAKNQPVMAAGQPAKSASAVMPVSFPSDGKIVFARDVEPILQQACLDCHGPAKHRANLRLDTKDVTLKGGAHGPAMVPGKSGESLIVQHVLALDGKKRMPMGRDPLTDAQVKILKAWIDQGADWPATSTIASAEQKTHWAYVKPVRPDIPAVKDRAWPKNPIDDFVLAKLEKEGMHPSPEADRRTLIRRVSLDLIGLPPTPEEVESFVNDPSPDAYDKVVTRLLSSPHYGERWGRHWLDLARYADTNGYEKDQPRVIWPYRDWVINALNRDMPFDQFVIDQIAGDMLPGATDEERIATGFHRNTMFNEEGGIDVEEFRFKAIVDRVQTTSTALLGLTMHCAQCHNHKYDDISQKDYYRFFAFFDNSDEPKMNVPDPSITEQRRQIEEKIEGLREQLASKFPARDDTIKWQVIAPDSFSTESKGSRLFVQSDKSVLAGGKNPENDNYTIVFDDVDLTGVTAFRLETLTDPSLPRNGPGRAGNGNFVLSQFKVEQSPVIADEDAPAPKLARIKIDRAEADYSQPEFEIVKAIDDYFQKGWAIGGAGVTTNASHTATFYTPDKLAGHQRLVISLLQKYNKKNNLGKFRLSVGRTPPPPTSQPTPAEREKFLLTKMDEWEKSVAPRCAHWTILDPTKFTRLHDATITKLADKSLLFTGDNFYREEYKLDFDTDAKNVTAIRIETLPHPDLPKGGPGRDPNGGFLLSELTAVASSTKNPATTRPVEFASASADVANDSVGRAIDGKLDSHWTVPGGAEPRTAVFKLKSPLEAFDGGTTLKLSMAQNQFSEISIGRLRVSVTSDENAGEASGLPDDVERIVLTPKEKRTPEQVARLRQHFLNTTPMLASQQQEIAALKASEPTYTTTLVMQERVHPRVTTIHKRGEFLQPTDPVTPAVPAILPPLPKDEPANRLTLAKWLVSDDNPLVARVTMNRIWMRYFGRGIVNSVEDFGVIGEMPSNPQLLDYLATEFQRQHWSLKAMHRLIVTSATYRQSSRLTPELEQRDPLNIMLARGPRLRVESEIVRDIALTASGLLNERVGGPSVFPPQPPGISELSYGPLKWTDSVGPDRYRRGMYTYFKRTAAYPMQITFDGPTAEVVCARRARSNTPLQALTTLNDTVFIEAAQALARRVMESSDDDPKARADEVFKLCVARPPDDSERKSIVDFYQKQLERFRSKSLDPVAIAVNDPKRVPAGMDVPELAAWTTVARAVLNLDETITKE